VSPFDPAVLANDPERRVALLRVAASALDAVDPFAAVRRTGLPVDPGDFARVVVLGLGKAAVAMGRAALSLVGDLPVEGVLVTTTGDDAGPLRVVEGSHPVPDRRSVTGGRALLETAAGVSGDDLAVVLISGGGSALAEVPAGDLTVADLQEMNGLLLRSGADITELNTVRKHLSRLKGGRLGEALAAAGCLVTFVLSDVVGNPLDVIASGPTVPDPTTYADALSVLDRHDLRERASGSVVGHLEAGAGGAIADTPSAGVVFDRQHLAIVADAGSAARAAEAAGEAEGWSTRVVTTELTGEAREVGRDLAAAADGIDPGSLLVHAGETTVTVTGEGTGGRNQELALAAGMVLEGRDDIVVLSIGTDGIDGTTDAAGAFGDGGLVARARNAGLDGADHLRRNDSNPLLAATGDLVVCGPTGTNVGDLVLVLRT
jgi:glycerate 2-kinase